MSGRNRRTGWLLTGLLLLALRAGAAELEYLVVTNSAAYPSNYIIGKTGLGTNNPAEQLHVAGESRLDGGLTVSGALRVAAGGDIGMGPFTNGVGDQGVISTNLSLRGAWVSYDGTSQGLYVATNGNVGVGSGAASPSERLQVDGNAVVTGTIYGTTTNANNLEGHPSSYFYPASNPSNWAARLTTNIIVNLTNSMTTAELQAALDGQPSDLGGNSVSFLAGAGTYDLTATLKIRNYHNGYVWFGGPNVSSGLYTNQTAIFNIGTNADKAIEVVNCGPVYIEDLKVTGNTAASRTLVQASSGYVWLNDCHI